MSKQNLSIIIPAYNEEEGIAATISKLRTVSRDYEIIVVDDGSTDSTYRITKRSGVKVIHHPYNKGYGAALKTGVRKASADTVLFIDADGTYDINQIPKIMEYTEEYDMVVGARITDFQGSLLRGFYKKILNALANYLAEMKIRDLNSGFRAVKKNIVMEFIHILPNSFSFTATLTLAMIKEGYNLKYIPTKTFKRSGKSKIKPLKDGFRIILLMLGMINLFSPLKVFLPVAILFFSLGSVSLLYDVIISKDITDMSLLLILTAIIIFFFGLLADQMAHIRRQIK